MMDAHYDPEYDSLYITTEHKPTVKYSCPMKDNSVILDFDADGNLVGIEKLFVGLSKYLNYRYPVKVEES